MIRDSIQGRAWKFGSNVSTDSIAPGRLISLRANPPEYAKHVLEDARPDFVKGVKADDFIVADRNFGCGSSREIAPIIIKLAGVGAVLSKSFGRIFYRNAINNGMLLIECDTDRIEEGDELFVDVKNRVIKKVNDPEFEMPFVLSEKEVKIMNEGGLLNYIEKYNSLDI
ncbi:LeuD/DmdB family oxidoreductase small subunit [Dysosmobacter sp.]|uniref:LeuD/DmdB family oxidoreductase small subunit n=1 Tax=Dysosmobacter sp. TaxID=2591382 RepID=UPI002A88B1B6|nr:3-isopropylmalate dehydratase [Dysosmobacter sp.]MDY3986176.1 3-isopropylmalate dehydratase [Dysosmobacter sp.]